MKSIKRAFEFGETFRYEMKIYDCGFYGWMPKEPFNGIKVSSLIQQVGGKAVTQGMDATFVYAGFFLAR